MPDIKTLHDLIQAAIDMPHDEFERAVRGYELKPDERVANDYPLEIVCGGKQGDCGVRVRLEYDEGRKLSKISCPIICPHDQDDGGCFSTPTAMRGACGSCFEKCKIVECKERTAMVRDNFGLIMQPTIFTENYVPYENFEALPDVAKVDIFSMKDYPYVWGGDKSGGVISEYCTRDGFVLHGPKEGELVLRRNTDGTQAFQVTYANEEARIIRVKPTDFYVQWNEVLKQYRSEFPHSLPDPAGSSISLVESRR